MVWCGVVCCVVVWCGVMWCGVVWCGVVCCGAVWSVMSVAVLFCSFPRYDRIANDMVWCDVV